MTSISNNGDDTLTATGDAQTTIVSREVRQPRRVMSQGALGKFVPEDVRIRQLSHTAVRVRDMEATRKYYEDLLELPMVSTLLADFDGGTGQPSDYLHCFFQMADGTMVAFFQFGEGFRSDVLPHQGDAYDRHLALRVDDIETVTYFKSKFEAAGVPGGIVDHDDFYSFYSNDPDGNFIEITWHKPSLESVLDKKVAHEMLSEWLAKQQTIREKGAR